MSDTTNTNTNTTGNKSPFSLLKDDHTVAEVQAEIMRLDRVGKGGMQDYMPIALEEFVDAAQELQAKHPDPDETAGKGLKRIVGGAIRNAFIAGSCFAAHQLIDSMGGKSSETKLEVVAVPNDVSADDVMSLLRSMIASGGIKTDKSKMN